MSGAGAAPMRWLELSVEVDVEAVEAVSEILGREATGTTVQPTRLIRDPADELAARPDLEAPHVVTAHVAAGPGATAVVERTERALWHLQAFGLRPIGALRVREVDDADWADAWRSHYVPQRIGRLVVVPSWLDEGLAPDELPIVLDPGMAFGTGLHPTTRGCLAMLQQVEPMPDRLLDVGIGSGILAIAALRLGAGIASGCDTDPVAVEASRENAVRNGLAERLDAWAGSLPAEPAATYPLVLANLVASVLVELAPRLHAHLEPGGTLLASGIIEPRGSEVEGALRAAGLALVDRRTDGEWISLRAERAR